MDAFNLIYLKYFIDAAEANNISVAAKKNSVTQSCVSQGIKKLEQILKVDLTMHLRNRFKLTEEGKIIFTKGKQVFKSLNSILDETLQSQHMVMGKVTIASTQSLALTFFPQIFQTVSKTYPLVDLKFFIGTIDQIHQWMKADEVDFALVLDQPEFVKFERHVLLEGRFNLYKHKSLKKLGKIYVDSISGLGTSSSKEETFELGSWELVAEFLDSKLGAGILPDFMTRRYKNFVPIQEIKFGYKICGIYQKGTKLSKASSSVLINCI